MAFRLKTIRDAQPTVFSTRKILELLGESVNDEIHIDGKAYRISSFEELGGEGGEISYQWQIQTLSVQQQAQVEFAFSASYVDNQSLFLLVNGSLYQYGENKDYHISAGLLHWHGSFSLETTDEVYLKFLQTI